MNFKFSKTICILLLNFLALLILVNTSYGQKKQVVIYTAHDRIFSEPILNQMKELTGIQARVKYDTEATKTIGLVNTLLAEKRRPRCDVWWNNEILNTIRLKKRGLLEPLDMKLHPEYPKGYFDQDGYWIGFAARARIIIVNTNLVRPGDEPSSIFDLTNEKWKGKAGIAKPLFGTTATHVAVLFSNLGEQKATEYLDLLKANDVKIEAGNRQVARKVAKGQLAIGLTDTDDAVVEITDGSPVKIIFPDSKPDQIGTLMIPNTVAKIKGSPNGQYSRRVIQYLTSLKVEKLLADSKAAQIPLNPEADFLPNLPGLENIKIMEVDFENAADHFEQAQSVIEKNFLK